MLKEKLCQNKKIAEACCWLSLVINKKGIKIIIAAV